MKRWEYKQIPENAKFEENLVQAGREGWEAYAVTQHGDPGSYTVWLKRELDKSRNPHVVR